MKMIPTLREGDLTGNFQLEAPVHAALFMQLTKDFALLVQFSVENYSLSVGIHQHEEESYPQWETLNKLGPKIKLYDHTQIP